MVDPKIDWPSSEETSDILAATGKTKSELEELIRASIRKAEPMAKLGRDYIDVTNRNPKPFVWTKSADDILASIERFCHRISGTGH